MALRRSPNPGKLKWIPDVVRSTALPPSRSLIGTKGHVGTRQNHEHSNGSSWSCQQVWGRRRDAPPVRGSSSRLDKAVMGKHGNFLRHLRMVPSEQLLEARAAADSLPTALPKAEALLRILFQANMRVGGHRVASKAFRLPRALVWPHREKRANIGSLARREIE